MTALIPHDTFADSAAQRRTILTAARQADFLQSLQLSGNVRLACRAASVSPQTAYRARRASSGFALAWDAALLAARAQAEAVLADRALNGVEEAVFYHGEEIARRRRFDSRLLLAHLARLDRLEARADIAAELVHLDERIEALRRGQALAEASPAACAQTGRADYAQDRVPCVPSDRPDGGQDEQAEPDPGPDDPQWLGHRLDRMDAARPRDAAPPGTLGQSVAEADAIERLQLTAFEQGVAQWWLLGADGIGVGDAGNGEA